MSLKEYNYLRDFKIPMYKEHVHLDNIPVEVCVLILQLRNASISVVPKCINLGMYSGYLVCGINENNCGNKCYNPSSHKCLYLGMSDYLVCANNEIECGKYKCYDPSTQKCFVNSAGYFVCGSNDGICGTQCYNLQYQKCFQSGNLNLVCSSFESQCGNRCFDPSYQKCIPLNSLGDYLICNSNEEQCGNQCYNPSTQKCINLGGSSGYLICNSNEEQCGNKCYNPTTQKCINLGYLEWMKSKYLVENYQRLTAQLIINLIIKESNIKSFRKEEGFIVYRYTEFFASWMLNEYESDNDDDQSEDNDSDDDNDSISLQNTDTSTTITSSSVVIEGLKQLINNNRLSTTTKILELISINIKLSYQSTTIS
eukprot:gene8083-9945_t